MTLIPSELEDLARLYGVQTSYVDVYHKPKNVSAESILAVLSAMGVKISSLDEVPALLGREQKARLERGLEPVHILWDDEPAEILITLPKSLSSGKIDYRIALEGQSGGIENPLDLGSLPKRPRAPKGYVTFAVPTPRLEWGYHRLSIAAGGKNYQSLLIAAPRRAYSADGAGAAEWGCFLPLYAVRSERNWGAGDFTDLHHLMNWINGLGGRVVGTLPLLAAFLDAPFDPSPYAPASRLAWNEFYVDIERIPELLENSRLKEVLHSGRLAQEIAPFRAAEHVPYRPLMELKRRFLEGLSQEFFEQKPEPRYGDFQRFLKTHPHLDDYAAFRATYEQEQKPWPEWNGTKRDGQLSEGDYDPRNKNFHLYAQWIATTQLESLAEAAGGGLYLDLPLGVRPDSYDVWRWRELYASESSAGSPPDSMWTKGQDWGFPPLHPERIREDGYRHVRAYIKHHLRLARILRVDHVMQLHRLYWVPRGLPAARGAYVQYRSEELYAVLMLESHRSRTTLVGENLGTVPPEVNDAMDRHNLQRMYVVQYEMASLEDPKESKKTKQKTPQTRPQGLKPIPPGTLASLNTHDMPTFAAWWRGEDIRLRQELDLIDEQEAKQQRQDRVTLKTNLTEWLKTENWLRDDSTEEQAVQLAILKYLAASEASVVMVNLEDLWLEVEPQNVPGTGPELRNWQRKAALAVEEFRQSPGVLAGLQAVAQFRAPQRQHSAD